MIFEILILSLLAALSRSRKINGEYRVVMLIEISRHGASTPKHENFFYESEKDILLKSQEKKLKRNGSKLRKHYLNFVKEIEENSQYQSLIKSYACSSPKCIKSARSKVYGVFQKKVELNFLDEIENWKNEKKLEKMKIMKSEMPMSIPVLIKEPENDELFLTDLEKICPIASKEKKIYIEKILSKFREGIDDILLKEKKKISKIFKKKKFKDDTFILKNYQKIYENLVYYKEIKGSYPKNCDEILIENLELVNDSKYFEFFKVKNLRLLYTSKISNLILEKLKSLQKNQLPNEKYISFTTNEDTLSAFLISLKHLNMDDAICGLQHLESSQQHKKKRKSKNCFKFPDFGSNILFEISMNKADGDFHVVLKYNNERFVFCYDGREYCRLDKFIHRFESRCTMNDFDTICNGEKRGIGILEKENLDYFYALVFMSGVLGVLIWRSGSKNDGQMKENSLMD